MVVLLIVVILLFAIPAWSPAIAWNELRRKQRVSMIFFTGSPVSQIVLLVGTSLEVVPLSYSSRFAAIGVLSCFLAVVFAITNEKHSRHFTGLMPSVILSILVWVFLITAH